MKCCYLDMSTPGVIGVCDNPVREWRQCGAGCKREIGYCAEHGGMTRATEEMARHVAADHGVKAAS